MCFRSLLNRNCQFETTQSSLGLLSSRTITKDLRFYVYRETRPERARIAITITMKFGGVSLFLTIKQAFFQYSA